MRKWYVHPDAVRRTTLTARADGTAYNIGDMRRPADANVYCVLYCTVAGTSGGAPPAYSPVYGNTVVDGGVTWEYRHTGEYNALNPELSAFHLMDTDYYTLYTANSDLIVLLTNGVDTYPLPSTYVTRQYVKIIVKNYANEDTSEFAHLTGYDFYMTAPVYLSGIWLSDSVTDGFVANGIGITARRCRANNNAGRGFWLINGFKGVRLWGCESYNNGLYGVEMADSATGAELEWCHIYGNTLTDVWMNGGAVRHCIVESYGVPCLTYVNSSPGDISNNLFLMRSDFASADGAVHFNNISANMVSFNDNYVRGAKTAGGAGTSVAVYAPTDAAGSFASFRGNKCFDCDNPVSATINADTVGHYAAMIEELIEFTDEANGDFSPTADTLTGAYDTAFFEEAPWQGTGPIPFIQAGGGGGISRGRLLNSGGF